MASDGGFILSSTCFSYQPSILFLTQRQISRGAISSEWKKAYLNYRGMKKLIKRVHEHRSKRLALAELERMASRGGSCPSGTGFPNFRRRGTFRGMTRRSTNDTDQDEPTIEPNALSSKEDQSFSPEGIARERDSLLPISLVGTGLQLQDDLLKSPSNLEEAGVQDWCRFQKSSPTSLQD